MIIIIHSRGQSVKRVLKDEKVLQIKSTTCDSALWELAEKFPDELIAWVEDSILNQVNFSKWKNIFHHQLIMASYSIKTRFFSDKIGYIDQSPYINVNRKVSYGTWQMGSDVGGIHASVLLRFKSLFSEIKNFDYLLNSIGKIGQENGLFCYHEPRLIKNGSAEALPKASNQELFAFVYQHYSSAWIFVLFWCFLKYEKSFPLVSFLRSFFNKKYFQASVDFSEIEIQSSKKLDTSSEIDVVIPTMGRTQHLIQVVKDLSRQTLLPKKIIIVEQNPDPNSKTELAELFIQQWPFEIVHHFIHQTGACNARNLALTEVNSDWVFLLDDDVRLEIDVLENLMKETKLLGSEVLSLSCLQKNEKKFFTQIKQWGTFGSGTSIVKKSALEGVRFSTVFEHGYGEDRDFGMQLRYKGIDVVYHPDIEILHLKAPMGGFRKKIEMEWEQENPQPKPSPTIMAFAMLHNTEEQIKGYKTSLFLKFYKNQPIKNPFKYISEMKKRWNISQEWAQKLLIMNPERVKFIRNER
ncbi:MAG TPA: glycosyltransferase family A protein [Salinimicrobium sp.]|nr:glycosyltransferase family A protein [Salinimicrobium sp.]